MKVFIGLVDQSRGIIQDYRNFQLLDEYWVGELASVDCDLAD